MKLRGEETVSQPSQNTIAFGTAYELRIISTLSTGLKKKEKISHNHGNYTKIHISVSINTSCSFIY